MTAGPMHRVASSVARHGLYVAPAVVGLAWLVRGGSGAGAAAIGIAIVVANLFASAMSLAWAARQAPNLLMVVALGGFLLRMAAVVVVLFVVRNVVDVPTLAVTVVVGQLGLLFWEARLLNLPEYQITPRPGSVGDQE